MTIPVVSVIVPAYNCAPFLAEALDSLRAQTLQDLEIIIVDDGSVDGTAAVVEEYARRDGRVRVHRRARSSGRPASARNEGLRMARGEFVALHDADDVALPEHLQAAVGALTRTGADLAFADFRKFGPTSSFADARHAFARQADTSHASGGYLAEQIFPAVASRYLTAVEDGVYCCSPSFVVFMLARMIAVNTPTVVFRRRLLEREDVWFDERLVGGEDLDLFYRLACHATMVFIARVHAMVRVSATSLTVVRGEQCHVDAIRARRTNLQRLEPWLARAERKEARRAVAASLFHLAYSRWADGAAGAARWTYWESWMLHPAWHTLAAFLKTLVPRAWIPQLRALMPPLRSLV